MSRPGWGCTAGPDGALWVRQVGPLCLIVEQDGDGCFWDAVPGEGPLGWGFAGNDAPTPGAAQVAAEQAARDIAAGFLARLKGKQAAAERAKQTATNILAALGEP